MKVVTKLKMIFSGFFILLSTIYLGGCKKMDASPDILTANQFNKFFHLPTSAAIGLVKTAEELRRQNDINEFIPTLVNQSGYPVWATSQVYYGKSKQTSNSFVNNFGEGEDTVAIVPFVEDNGSQVSAFLISRINNGTKLYLYRANDYDRFKYGGLDADYISSDKIVYQLVLLNENIFGRRAYAITDTMLFRGRQQYDSAYRTIRLNDQVTDGAVNAVSAITNNFGGGFYVQLCGWTIALDFTGNTYNQPGV